MENMSYFIDESLGIRIDNNSYSYYNGLIFMFTSYYLFRHNITIVGHYLQ